MVTDDEPEIGRRVVLDQHYCVERLASVPH